MPTLDRYRCHWIVCFLMNAKGVEAFVPEIQSNEGAPPHLVFIQLYAQQTCKNRSDGSKQVLKVTYTFHIDRTCSRCSFANAIKLLLTPLCVICK